MLRAGSGGDLHFLCTSFWNHEVVTESRDYSKANAFRQKLLAKNS